MKIEADCGKNKKIHKRFKIVWPKSFGFDSCWVKYKRLYLLYYSIYFKPKIKSVT